MPLNVLVWLYVSPDATKKQNQVMQLDPILWTFLVSFQDAKGTFVLIEFAELLLGHSLQQELYPSPMKGCKIQDGLSTSRLNMSETGRMNVSKS